MMGRGMGQGAGGMPGRQQLQQMQLQLQQQQLLIKQLQMGRGMAAASEAGAADMMDDDAEYGNGGALEQPNMRGSNLTIVPEVWLNEDTGDVVATLKGTDIVTGAVGTGPSCAACSSVQGTRTYTCSHSYKIVIIWF